MSEYNQQRMLLFVTLGVEITFFLPSKLQIAIVTSFCTKLNTSLNVVGKFNKHLPTCLIAKKLTEDPVSNIILMGMGGNHHKYPLTIGKCTV